jgi:hypothetical protein
MEGYENTGRWRGEAHPLGAKIPLLRLAFDPRQKPFDRFAVPLGDSIEHSSSWLFLAPLDRGQMALGNPNSAGHLSLIGVKTAKLANPSPNSLPVD